MTGLTAGMAMDVRECKSTTVHQFNVTYTNYKKKTECSFQQAKAADMAEAFDASLSRPLSSATESSSSPESAEMSSPSKSKIITSNTFQTLRYRSTSE